MKPPVVILGGGPAGLGAAYRLARRGRFDVIAIERAPIVGGNAGSFELGGLRVDYGSHRLHPSCGPEILADIQTMLGGDLLDRPRHGRIRLLGRWVHFPLKAADLAAHLPPSFAAGVAADNFRKVAGGGRRAVSPGASSPEAEETFASVLQQGLGRTICRHFYFPYARKIWGLDPEALDAEQARRRVGAGSMLKMARKILSGVPGLNAIPGLKKKGAGRFYYPRRGFGAISDAYAEAAIGAGARLKLKTSVAAIETSAGRVQAVRVIGPDGEERIEARQVFSTIPISQLVKLIGPSAPEAVQISACSLKFRAMILVYLVLGTEQFTEYDAHYFPEAKVVITRLSEPKNYGLAANPGRTVLCAELPCSVEDPVWRASDSELGRIVTDALAAADLPVRCPVTAIASRKLAQAYPIYTRDYREHFERLDDWVGQIDGLVTFGRQGLFAHDNTHHALAMAYALDGCLREDASLDHAAWVECRRGFQEHVVED